MSLSELKITNSEYDLRTGFFWVEFKNGKTLQCCLKEYVNDDYDGFYYAAQVEIDNNGHDEGVCGDVNEWAADGGEWGHINEFLIEEARKAGLEIVA